MAEIVVTDEAVEVGARELFEDAEGPFVQGENPWLTSFEESRRPKYTRRSRRVLEAAAPLLQVELPTREQIAEAMHNHWSKTHAWRQGCDEDVCIAIFLDRADAIVALFPEEARNG